MTFEELLNSGKSCENNKCMLLLSTCVLCVGVILTTMFVDKDLRSAAIGTKETPPWWRTCIFYQVYPQSFQDTDGDGIGDIQGIISRLDHFRSLGVGAIWVSPFFRSPMLDNGYDVSDYNTVNPLFGYLQDFKQLVNKLHANGLYIVIDFIPNHTSDQHEWFVQSKSDRTSDYRDFYIWNSGKILENGTRAPPNNWKSIGTRSAWTWDERSQQYYYHRYQPAQPDLNLRNPRVLDKLDSVLRFWLDTGVDGFRVDAIRHLFEAENIFLDDPPGQRNIYTRNLPDIFPLVKRWKTILDEYTSRDERQRVLICETNGIPSHQRQKYYELGGVPFYYGLISAKGTFGAQCVRNAVVTGLDIGPGNWPNFVLGSHDVSRICDRWGPAYVDVMNMLLLTLPGTITTYYGEEIGMCDVTYTRDETKDNAAIFANAYSRSCDPERSPMQWNTSMNAGFSTGIPWLHVPQGYQALNVEKQTSQSSSTLALYRKLSSIRQELAFQSRDISLPDTAHHVLTYIRGDLHKDYHSYAVTLNLGTEDEAVSIPEELDRGIVKVTTPDLSDLVNTTVRLSEIVLKPGQGMLVYLLKTGRHNIQNTFLTMHPLFL